MAFALRKIATGDEEVFLRMSEEFFASDAVLHNVPAEYHQRCFDELMRSEDYARGFMLLWDGLEVGYALLSLSYSREAGGLCVWIEEIYLRPEYRGRGGAHFFLGWLEENLPAARYRLETESDNHAAKKLYGSLGYKPLEYEQLIKEN